MTSSVPNAGRPLRYGARSPTPALCSAPPARSRPSQVYSVFSFGGRVGAPKSPMDKFKDSPRGKQYAAMADAAVNKVVKDIKERN